MGTCAAMAPTRYTRSMLTAAELPFVSACSAAGRQTVLTSTDDASTTAALPFAFRYWAADLAVGTRVGVSSNGFIAMDGNAISGALTGAMPVTSAPNAVIAPYWSDLRTSSSGICVATVGTAPRRQWAVEWLNASHFSGGGSLTFEVVLNEGSGVIELMYGAVTGAQASTVGIENQSGTEAVSGCASPTAYNCVPVSNARVRFTPAP